MKMENTTLNKEELTVVLLAAGTGERYKSKSPKQFSWFKGKPMIAHSLIVIKKILPFKELIIATQPCYQKRALQICKRYAPALVPTIRFCSGGKTRQESLFNALSIATGKTLLLHEAARPSASISLFTKLLEDKRENITLGIPIPFTVLEEEQGFISKLLDRSKLFNVQLPQKFNLQKLYDAHKKAREEHLEFTDDSSLLFYYKTPVTVLLGETSNVKMTYSKKDI